MDAAVVSAVLHGHDDGSGRMTKVHHDVERITRAVDATDEPVGAVVAQHLALRRADRRLDIGAGSGPLTHAVANVDGVVESTETKGVLCGFDSVHGVVSFVAARMALASRVSPSRTWWSWSSSALLAASVSAAIAPSTCSRRTVMDADPSHSPGNGVKSPFW